MDFGALSLLPSLIAIGLAIKTKNVIFSLFCGCLTGVLLLCAGVVPGIKWTGNQYLCYCCGISRCSTISGKGGGITWI